MFSLQDIEISRVLSRKDHFCVYVKYMLWWKEYCFMVYYDGRVKGKAGSGLWLDASEELRTILLAKLKSLFIEKRNLVYL
jgi:hypothetical protein